jgi:hypothetical protein
MGLNIKSAAYPINSNCGICVHFFLENRAIGDFQCEAVIRL